MNTRAGFLLLTLATAASPAMALSVSTICFKIETHHTDTAYADTGTLQHSLSNGTTTEDYWNRNVDTNRHIVFREMTGFKFVDVTGGGGILSATSGYLGDALGTGDPGLGCTEVTTFNSSGTVQFTFTSETSVNSNVMKYLDITTQALVQSPAVTCSFQGGAQTDCSFLLNFSDDNDDGGSSSDSYHQLYNAAATHAFTLRRHPAAVTGFTKHWQIGNQSNTGPTGCGCEANTADDDDASNACRLSYGNASTQKFGMAHELGHWVACRAMGSTRTTSFTPAGYIHEDVVCSEDNQFGGHSMRSIEGAGTAFNEGFPHFYAADAWNSHSQSDCAFNSGKKIETTDKPTIDCQAEGSGDLSVPATPRRWMETECADSPHDTVGLGSEVDWMRTFWDMHTKTGPGPVSMEDIIWLVRESPGWNGTSCKGYRSPYYVLNDFAASANNTGVRFIADSVNNGLDGMVSGGTPASADYCGYTQSDNWCPAASSNDSLDLIEIDQGLPTALNALLQSSTNTLTYEDVAMAADQSLQNLVRHSRGWVRARINRRASGSQISCHVNDGNTASCITHDDGTISSVCAAGAQTHTDCSPTLGCFVILCTNNLSSFDLGGGEFPALLQRELAKVLGIASVDDGTGTGHMPSGCFSSKGCDGNMMCTGEDSFAVRDTAFVASGDASGLRATNLPDGGTVASLNREIHRGTRAAGSSTVDFSSLSSRDAAFAPRIDCADTLDRCVGVRHEFTSTSTTDLGRATGDTAVFILDDYDSGDNVWLTATDIATAEVDAHFPPDIAISPDGSEAYYTRVSTWELGATYVARVDLSTGSRTEKRVSDTLRAALPPRIVFDDDLDDPILVWAVQEASTNDTPSPKWQMHRVGYASGSLTFTLLDAGGLDDSPAEGGVRAIAADFDVDCRYVSSGSSPCTLVAILHSESDNAHSLGSIYSRGFSVASNGTVTMDSAWTSGRGNGTDFNAQAILGVAMNSSELFVSVGINRVSSDQNTRHLEFTGTGVGSTENFGSVHSSDRIVCAASSKNGTTLGKVTPHGGYSIAWCPSCGSGRIESLHVGARSDGDTACW